MSNRTFLRLFGVAILGLGGLYGLFPRLAFEMAVGLPLYPEYMHVLRSLGGLYCGVGIFLLISAEANHFQRQALVMGSLYFASLAGGRLVSALLDGSHSPFMWGSTVVELVGVVLLWRRYQASN